MSTPISACTIFKAALGDPKSEEWLVRAMFDNLRRGAFTLFPCNCNPPCAHPTEEQLEVMEKRVHAAVAALREEQLKKSNRRSLGTFDKFLLPVIKTVLPSDNIRDILT